ESHHRVDHNVHRVPRTVLAVVASGTVATLHVGEQLGAHRTAPPGELHTLGVRAAAMRARGKGCSGLSRPPLLHRRRLLPGGAGSTLRVVGQGLGWARRLHRALSGSVGRWRLRLMIIGRWLAHPRTPERFGRLVQRPHRIRTAWPPDADIAFPSAVTAPS